MRRRDFLALLGGAAVATPFAARAQQPAPKRHRIGFLETVPAADNAAHLDAFRKGLEELGHVQGKSYVVEYRSVDGVPERFPQLAAELVQLKVDVIVTRGTPAALAAKAATTTIPVVMASSGDPVGTGIVASLARPGGNITGLSSFGTELAGKRVELLNDLLTGVSRIGYLGDASNPVVRLQWEETRKAAGVLGLQAELLDVRIAADIERTFEVAVARKIGAIAVAIDSVMQSNRHLIVDQAARHRLPAVSSSREFVDAGGLMSFRVSYQKLYFRAASLVDKVLKGVKPADIPVEQPMTLEMVVNLKTANTLGLTIPDTILIRADELIE
jgi:putative ABC transport system substrate-binding protein